MNRIRTTLRCILTPVLFALFAWFVTKGSMWLYEIFTRTVIESYMMENRIEQRIHTLERRVEFLERRADR